MKGAHSATALHRLAGLLFAAGVGCASALVTASASEVVGDMEASAGAVARRHSPEVMRTEADANAALAAVKSARVQVEWAAYDQNLECAARFFRSACEADVRQRQRSALESLRLVEIDAERFIRRVRDAEREAKRQEAFREADAQSARLAEQQAQAQADFARKQEKADAAPVALPPAAAQERAPTPPHAPSVSAAQAAERVNALERKRLDAEQRRREAEKRQADRTSRQGAGSTP